MSRYDLLGDIFERVKKFTKNADKAEWLKQHAGLPVFYIIWLGLSNQVEWALPEGAPPFKAWEDRAGRKMRPGSEPSDLRNELRRLYLFLKDHPVAGKGGNHVPQLKREKIFQEVLEALPASDVKLLISLKDKTFSKDYRISRQLIETTFPGLFEAPFKLKFISRR